MHQISSLSAHLISVFARLVAQRPEGGILVLLLMLGLVFEELKGVDDLVLVPIGFEGPVLHRIFFDRNQFLPLLNEFGRHIFVILIVVIIVVVMRMMMMMMVFLVMSMVTSAMVRRRWRRTIVAVWRRWRTMMVTMVTTAAAALVPAAAQRVLPRLDLADNDADSHALVLAGPLTPALQVRTLGTGAHFLGALNRSHYHEAEHAFVALRTHALHLGHGHFEILVSTISLPMV